MDPLYDEKKIKPDADIPEQEALNARDEAEGAEEISTSKAKVFFSTMKNLMNSSDERKAFINFIKELGKGR